MIVGLLKPVSALWRLVSLGILYYGLWIRGIRGKTFILYLKYLIKNKIISFIKMIIFVT